MNPLQNYLTNVQQQFQTGQAVKETSFYPALSILFDEVGKELSPRVFCVTNIANRGAGLPDGGFFSASQQKSAAKNDDAKVKENPLLAMLPERGVLEVKGAAQDLDELKNSAQVGKYLDKYGQILITNLRQFALIERDANGVLAEVERFTLANSADDFWKLNAQNYAKNRGEEFGEYLKRCLLSGAPLNSPQDVAAFLASYAREARLRLEREETEKLLPLKQALENVLGVSFEADDSKLPEKQRKEKGERFFRATLVQTLFYGLFSAWLSHVEEQPNEPFNWKEAQWSLHVPAVSILFEQLMQKSSLKETGLQQLIELAARVLNRVQTTAFFEKWESALAVQYFYEPFLEKFDPVLRKELGVYYTPPEIVKYMVERVHRVLKTELNRPLGLADPDVVILDPCCGTGAYVVEVLRKIGEELKATSGAFLAHDLKTVVVGNASENKDPRVFGFEILPAPFVVAHHGVARVLAEHGAKLEGEERAAIYLTNALTGWTEEPKTKVLFSELEKEREASQKVKRQTKILVILGNPPYDAFAKITEDADLVKPYKTGLQSKWGIKKFNLDDLYIRFFRVAERRLAECGEGVLCFITNYSWTSEPSFVQMRKSLLHNFDALWIENMHGNRKISEYAPDGRTSETVFALPGFSSGIRQGITISTLVKRPTAREEEIARVLYRDDIDEARAVERRQQLLDTLNETDFDANYEIAQPKTENRFSLRPSDVTAEYSSWPRLTELSEIAPFQGLAEDRRKALIDESRDELEKRISLYYNADISWEELVKQSGPLIDSYVDFPAKEVREKVLKEEDFSQENIRRFTARPFDSQFCYYTAIRPVWRRQRPAYFRQAWDGNSFLLSRFKAHQKTENIPVYFSKDLADYHCIAPNVGAIPFFLRREIIEALEPDETGKMQEKIRVETTANLSVLAREYLASLQLPEPDGDAETAALLWRHALAIGYAPAYRAEHADGLSGDWPRVPLPNELRVLEASAQLGEQVAALLDVAIPLPGVSTAPLRAGLSALCALTRTDEKPLQPQNGDLKIEASWGHFGGRGEVMAGQGKVVLRAPNTGERAALDALGLHDETVVCDVYLNERVYWRAIPQGAWQTVIGGYQVMKKWLSYRDFKVLGRDLTVAEARAVESMARRLTVLKSLETALDESYRAAIGSGKERV